MNIQFYKSEKGVALIITSLAILVVLGVSATFFARSVSEKRVVDVEKFTMQADFLAESGANHGLVELQKRIKVDLPPNISPIRNSSTIRNYYTGNDPLGFLQVYALESGSSQFRVEGGRATLALSALSLDSDIDGTYQTNIIVTPNGNPTNPASDKFVFYYNYEVVGSGTSSAISPNINKTVTFYGNFVVTAQRKNFAKYALFTNNHRAPRGTTVWFTDRTNFEGPVHTNDRLSFANNPSGHFTDEVTQHLTKARFYNNGRNRLLNDDHNGVIDVPIFDDSFTRGESLLNLESAVTSNDLRTEALGTMTEPGTSGIYVPNDGASVTGGVYIRGTADDVQLTTDASNNQKIVIQQGSTTKNVIVDYSADTTTVETVGGSTEVYSGIPDGVGDEGIIVYSKDDIYSFHGTVQADASITVSCERDIVISDNVRYQNYDTSPSLNADSYNNMLGILAWGGDVRIGSSAPDNVEIHGIVMAPHGIFTVDNYRSGSPRGTATLLGGVITDFYGPFGTFRGTTQRSGFGRNFVYDPRVLAGQTPPYFPYMRNFEAQDDGGLDDRPRWKRD